MVTMLVAVVLVLGSVGGVWGHGYMIEPPARSSMWRVGFDTPKNYNDMSLNCGGYGNNYLLQHGRCGVCGDAYTQSQPRDNEAGGKYATGKIARQYRPGQEIPLSIVVTGDDKGYFEFRLCKNDNVKQIVTQSCLDQNILTLKNTATRFNLPPAAGTVHLTAVLPAGLTCSQCVLQWKWHAGNNYGYDSSGHGCMGCGFQEETYGCADVSIGSNGGQVPTSGSIVQINRPFTFPPVGTPRPPTLAPVVTQRPQTFVPVTQRPQTPPPVVVTQQPLVTLSHGSQVNGNYGAYSTCHAVNSGGGFQRLNSWCVENCAKGSCSLAICYCPDVINFGSGNPGTVQGPVTGSPSVIQHVTGSPSVILGGNGNNQPWVAPTPTRATGHNQFDSCRGTGLWGTGSVALDNWCIENCALGNCPSIQCYCPSIHGSHPPNTPNLVLNQPTTRTPLIVYPPTTKSPPILNPPTTKSPPIVNPLTTRSPPIVNPIITKAPPVFFVHPTTRFPLTVQETTKAPSVILGGNPQNTVTHASGHGRFDSCRGAGLWDIGIPALDNWCIRNCALGNCPRIQCQCPDIPGHQLKTTSSPAQQITTKAPTAAPVLKPEITPGPHPIPSVTPYVHPQATPSHAPYTAVPPVYSRCRAVNNWRGVPQLDEWCQRSCSVNYCPTEMCIC